jgi:polysaccharide chain length determinant protein (PEP-CTERM system associated)
VDDIQKLISAIWDDVRSSWRFRWIALAAGWLICLFGWIYVLKMPNVYQANARVYLNTQSALRPLLQGLAVSPDVESDLALVRQALLSRPQMEKVARQTELDLSAKTAEDKERLIAGLQKNIVIETDSRVRNSATDGLYRITFHHSNRVQALGVVQRVLDAFVDDTLGTKRTGQEDAQRFLQEQIDEYEKRLSEAENLLSEFKKKNVGSMPDDRGDYFARMQTELAGLESARMQMRTAEARREEINRQLSGEDPFIFGIEDTTPQPGSAQGGGDLAVRIQELEGRLSDLLLRYTEKHPEVIAVRNTLNDLRTQQAAEIEKVKRERKVSAGMSSQFKSNPAYQSMDLELKRASIQIAELRQDVQQREVRVAELRRRVDMVPEVEAQLARLNRDYEVTRAQYQQLVQRLETAKLSESADRTGIVNFQIIEPPAVKFEPVSPKRTILLAGVLILGLGAAIALAYGANLLRPVFVSSQRLALSTGVAVLGAIGHSAFETDRVRTRKDYLLFAAASLSLFGAFVIVTGFTLYDGGRLFEQLLH